MNIISWFLVACTRLYTPLCRSVGWLVGWLVCLSDGRSVTHLFFQRFWAVFASLLLPNRTRLILPCTRPCSVTHPFTHAPFLCPLLLAFGLRYLFLIITMVSIMWNFLIVVSVGFLFCYSTCLVFFLLALIVLEMWMNTISSIFSSVAKGGLRK